MTATVAATATALPSRRSLLLAALAAGLGVVFVLAVGYGPVPIGAPKVGAILFDAIGLPLPVEIAERDRAIILAIRLPRACLGVLVGAGLALAGALLQGLFRNPLADPQLIGVSGGAALAAAATIVLGTTALKPLIAPLGSYALPMTAFFGSLAATALIYRLSTVEGRTFVATMLLAGIAVNALAMAGLGYLTFLSDDRQLRDITFWMLGSLGGATWGQVGAVAPFILLPCLLAPRLARALNALILGEREAQHLGFDIEAVKLIAIAAVALAVGASVAVSGVIGFVGLVVPHLVRLLLGSDHRGVLAGSALLGAALILAADLVARVCVAPAELPIGIVTAILGAPFFIWLLITRRQEVT